MAPLGTAEYRGHSRFYATGPKSTLDFAAVGANGDFANVAVTLRSGEKCTGLFKLVEMDSSCWNVFCAGHHRYEGHFDAGLAEGCQALTQAAGGAPLVFRTGYYREFWILQRRSVSLLDSHLKRVAGPWTFDPQAEAPTAQEVDAMNDRSRDDDE
jgi:hypothetical protein